MDQHERTLKGESIVCFGGEDWWYHHPHSKHHLLKRYARQNKVLFVNSISMGLPSISNPDFLLKIRRKLKSYGRWLRKVPEGLWVMTPVNFCWPCARASVVTSSATMKRLKNQVFILRGAGANAEGHKPLQPDRAAPAYAFKSRAYSPGVMR